MDMPGNFWLRSLAFQLSDSAESSSVQKKNGRQALVRFAFLFLGFPFRFLAAAPVKLPFASLNSSPRARPITRAINSVLPEIPNYLRAYSSVCGSKMQRLVIQL
jgi:hypothetical protein